MREQYSDRGLPEDDLDADPIVQFRVWFDAWAAASPYDPNAMIVSTIDDDGWPSARAVLLKGLDERGFVFHTNRQSAKGRDLKQSARAALTFLWHPVERQVRVVGDVELLPDDESDAYFTSRPRDSQIGAWASQQSAVISDRQDLESAVGGDRSRVSRRGASTQPLGRIHRAPPIDRVLAGTVQPSSRSAPISAASRRLDHRAAGPLTRLSVRVESRPRP